MCSESAETRLAQNIVPVDDDIDPNYNICQRPAYARRSLAMSPFTRGGKLGLLKALRSYDDIFSTLLPRYSVWLKYREDSSDILKRSDGIYQNLKGCIPGIIKWPAIINAPIKLSTASFRSCDMGI